MPTTKTNTFLDWWVAAIDEHASHWLLDSLCGEVVARIWELMLFSSWSHNVVYHFIYWRFIDYIWALPFNSWVPCPFQYPCWLLDHSKMTIVATNLESLVSPKDISLEYTPEHTSVLVKKLLEVFDLNSRVRCPGSCRHLISQFLSRSWSWIANTSPYDPLYSVTSFRAQNTWCRYAFCPFHSRSTQLTEYPRSRSAIRYQGTSWPIRVNIYILLAIPTRSFLLLVLLEWTEHPRRPWLIT